VLGRRRAGLLAAIALVAAAGAYVAGSSLDASAAAAPRPRRHGAAGAYRGLDDGGAGHPAAWVAERSGVTLMRFDQSLVHLTLHAGSSDGGVVAWTYGDQITPREIHLVLAAFNGGFKLTYRDVGFMSGGHVAVALKPGLASIGRSPEVALAEGSEAQTEGSEAQTEGSEAQTGTRGGSSGHADARHKSPRLRRPSLRV
jgi:hypothetical protein